MKTQAEIDAILRDAQNKARLAHKAEMLDAARQHAAGAGTLHVERIAPGATVRRCGGAAVGAARVASFDAAGPRSAVGVRPVRDRAHQDRHGDEVWTGAAERVVNAVDTSGRSRSR